ncbi:MAG: DEAD/DEAH box helicase family protein [Planctomycetes bacterium]|nr:DEAD/DEAH box helicase family protein [Planctomycetota bacterium]
MDLYPYQKELISNLYKIIRDGAKKILLYAPTGAGKTVIVSKVIQDANSKNRKILFLVHRNELVQQTMDTLSRFGLEAGVIKAGWQSDASKNIQVASIQTLNARGTPDNLDIVFIDECHTTSYFKSCKSILKSHHGIIIGITATPWRTKKREGLSEYYDHIVKAPVPAKLIDMNFLVPPIYYGYDNEIDLKTVRTMAGEFVTEDLDVLCNTPDVIKRVVEEYKKLALGRTCICFAINVEHAKNIALAFNQSGIAAAHIEAATHPMARSDKYQALARGEIKLLSSVGVLTEGFDIRSISAIILARPTQSMALNYQMVGRGLRTSKETNKEDCIVIDFANNTERHGMVQSLDEIEMDNPMETESKQMTKSCPNCNHLIELNIMECPQCGYAFQPGEGENQKTERLDDLIKLLPPDEAKKRKLFHKYARYAYENGLKPTWAAIKYRAKYRKWPKDLYKYQAVFGNETQDDDQQSYLNYLVGVVENHEIKDPKQYIVNHMQWEFGDKLVYAEETESSTE